MSESSSGSRSRDRVAALVLTLALLAVPSVLAQGGSPCAPISANVNEVSFADFGTLIEPGAALFGDGTGIVVFTASPSVGDGDRNGVLGIFVDQDGQPVGDAFQVNTLTEQDQFEASVAAAPDGRFVVVWQSDISPGDTDSGSIRGRLFGADGLARGNDFQINDFTAGNQVAPQVGMAADGSFVVTWESQQSPGDDDSGASVQARRFDADGDPRGSQFQVNSRTSSTQGAPDVGVAPDGRFVVVFGSRDSAGSDSNSDSVQARRYAANGQAQGAEEQVNVTTQGSQNRPRVAVDADGSYLVVWQSASSAGSDDQGRSVQARGFLASGVAAGNEVQVNERIYRNDELPDVAAVGGREFLVVWVSPVEGVVYADGAARAMNLEGGFLGFEYTVSPSVTESVVAGNRNGASLVASRAIARDGGIVGNSYTHPCATGEGVTECTEGSTTLCLNQDRFRVTLSWRDAQGNQGAGQAVELTPDTGYFWIFDAANVEVVVKLLNACGFNDRYWAFIAGLTDVEIDLIVEDTQESVVRMYESPLGAAFDPVTDTSAFDTCP
ncbi:MAG TPA: hypothetical protein VMT85_15700 [Thermoanaerobaculia bacterium]|nr:hypothetical protein [Thermoanaerobaculia bacterium]